MGVCPGYTETSMTTNHATAKFDTFEFSQPLTQAAFSRSSQPAAIVGEHLVQVIAKSQNGSLWISTKSTLEVIDSDKHFKF